MRWKNLEVDEQLASLPGYGDGAVVRHFDAPEALQTRFYEVEAKSILNRVPEQSAVPFRWTVNPYRGCAHACTYCTHGSTPILMADGTHRPIEQLVTGDAIYGTVYRGKYRKYVRTTVIDKWVTVKPAYRVELADGTELVASGDHRFLSNRGWKHVVGSASWEPDRPHLTTRNYLVGTGRFEPQPENTDHYRRGYLCGVIRGDGTIGEYVYQRGRRTVRAGGFRLSLVDLEALWRTRAYLREEQIATSHRVFAAAAGACREAQAIYCGLGASTRIAPLIEWPVMPRLDWLCGFLAGIFDAEGSCSGSALRISNTDPLILRWTEAAMHRLGFATAIDRTSNRNGLASVRLLGGLREHLRFFHLTDPAISRKRSIEGKMVKTFDGRERLRINSIEPVGELPLYDITTGTGDFIANGVVSHNCFARPTHKYLDFDAGRDFEREIVVKVNAPERLRVELARPSWKGEHVALGTNTDPYQWVEGRYELMRGIWRAMRDARNPCSVLTKSPLLVRDLDLMREISAVTDFSAALSVPTIDERAWRSSEPRTPSPLARLEALKTLTDAGIRTGVLIAPLMPGVNDDPGQVREILERAREAGAEYVSGIALHLRGDVRKVFMEWLSEARPDLVERYRALYARGAYAPPTERRRLQALLQGAGPSQWRIRNGARPAEANPAPAAEGPLQQALF